MTAMHEPGTYAVPEAHDDYPWIRAWATIIDYDQSWLARMLDKARASQAPRTALSKMDGQRWRVLEDITDVETRQQIIDWSHDYGYEIPERVIRVWVDPTSHRPPMEIEGPLSTP